MSSGTRFGIRFAPEVVGQLDAVERKYHGLIRKAIEAQLTHAPEQETINRKPLEQPAAFGATWELRCGPSNRFRIFYEVAISERAVSILAIGIKERDRLLIGGEEFEL
jgi:mRNA-degrading endonuclease RelE of RelBE toxin-antitoxin system